MKLKFWKRPATEAKEEDFEIGAGRRVASDISEKLARKDFESLELCYLREPIMFAGINIYTRCISETRPTITSDDRRTQEAIDEILSETSWTETFYDFAPRHLGIYGNCFIEKILNKQKTRIVDFCVIDPKTMDFLRDNLNEVIFDDYGRPRGWVQEIVGKPKVEFTRETMIHLTINQVNRGTMGIGFIEPVYDDITLKENIEQAKAQAAFRKGFPLPMITFGTDQYPPNAKMKERADRLGMELADEKTTWVSLPHYFKVDAFQADDRRGRDAITQELLYSTNLQAAVLGIPTALLLMTGEHEQRATLEPLIEFFEYNLKGIQQSLRIEEIMNDVLRKNRLPGRCKVKWKELSEKSAKEAVMRIMRLGKVGLLDTADAKIRDQVKRLVSLD